MLKQWKVVPFGDDYAILFNDRTYFTQEGIGGAQEPVLFNSEVEAQKLSFFGYERVAEFSEEESNVSL